MGDLKLRKITMRIPIQRGMIWGPRYDFFATSEKSRIVESQILDSGIRDIDFEATVSEPVTGVSQPWFPRFSGPGSSTKK